MSNLYTNCCSIVKNHQKELLKKYNFPLLIKKAIQELQGISAAIIFDGIIDDSEIDLLDRWILRNDEFLVEYPLSELKELFSKIMEDGIATEDERMELFSFLDAIAANPEGDVVVHNIFDSIENLKFINKRYIFTGELQFGSRTKAQNNVIKRGGNYSRDVNNLTDYLVIGSLGSESYSFGKFGTKIKKAMNLRHSSASNLKIVSENDFIRNILNTPILSDNELGKIKDNSTVSYKSRCPECSSFVSKYSVECKVCGFELR